MKNKKMFLLLTVLLGSLLWLSPVTALASESEDLVIDEMEGANLEQTEEEEPQNPEEELQETVEDMLEEPDSETEEDLQKKTIEDLEKDLVGEPEDSEEEDDSADANLSSAGEWIKSGNRWWYRYADGSYPVNRIVNIDGVCYAFDIHGWMQTGWVNHSYYPNASDYDYGISGWFYFLPNGAMVTGWHYFEGNWYYFSPTFVHDGIFNINGKRYCFDENGAMKTGWYGASYGGYTEWYYFAKSGEMHRGWLPLGDACYYLDDKTGVMYADDWFEIDTRGYQFDESGALLTGWYEEYFIGDDGEEYIGLYYVSENGGIHTGWLKYGQEWYYLDPETGYLCVDGWYEINDKLYVFDEYGTLLTGWREYIYTDEAGMEHAEWYYYTPNGDLYTGWLKSGGVWYYLDPETGVMYADDLYEIDGEVYGFKSSGAMITGWYDDTYVEEDSESHTLWWYFNSNGSMHTGWLKYGQEWYYLDPETGVMYANDLYDIGEKVYGFEESGAMITGWCEFTYVDENGNEHIDWYYFDSNGSMHHGWLNWNGENYYLDLNTGIMYADGVYVINGAEYYFHESGQNRYGWYKEKEILSDGSVNYYWEYYERNGLKVENGWIEDNGKEYLISYGRMVTGFYYGHHYDCYFYEDGSVAKGWFIVSEQMSDGSWRHDWYYAHESGWFHNGWLEYEGNKYYIVDGKMIRDCVYWIFNDSQYGKFDENGIYLGQCDIAGNPFPPILNIR